ncbi:15834_t:CDS:2 [Rhizophagus irregularis]|nr:15834_t:CDS:2 [Rhizophagus irregularis]
MLTIIEAYLPKTSNLSLLNFRVLNILSHTNNANTTLLLRNISSSSIE